MLIIFSKRHTLNILQGSEEASGIEPLNLVKKSTGKKYFREFVAILYSYASILLQIIRNIVKLSELSLQIQHSVHKSLVKKAIQSLDVSVIRYNHSMFQKTCSSIVT